MDNANLIMKTNANKIQKENGQTTVRLNKKHQWLV